MFSQRLRGRRDVKKSRSFLASFYSSRHVFHEDVVNHRVWRTSSTRLPQNTMNSCLPPKRAAKMSRKPGRKAALTAPTQQPQQLTWKRERPQMCRSARPRPGALPALRPDCFQLPTLRPAGPASICAGALLQLKFPLDEIGLAQGTSLHCKTQGSRS